MAASLPNIWVHRLVRAGAILSTVLVVNTSYGAEPNWPTQPYKYLIVDQDIRDVLKEFGANTGFNVRMSSAVAGGRVRGEYSVVSARDFLQRICGAHGLVWYFDGSLLYISAESETRTELMTLSLVKPNRLVDRIKTLGIDDARYPIRTTGNAGVVSVSGPPPYLALVRQTVAALEKSMAPQPVQEVPDGDEKKVRVFRGTREGS